MVNFETDSTTKDLIWRIVDRIGRTKISNYSRMDAAMDITAVHCNGCQLNLKGLLKADSFDFCHDIFGIRDFLDRHTGELTRHFLPRYAAKVDELPRSADAERVQ